MQQNTRYEHSRFLSDAVECMSEAVYITDLQNNIIYANSAFLQMHGYSMDELSGKNISMFCSNKVPADFYEQISVQALKGAYSAEVLAKGKSGRDVPISIKVSPFKDISGKYVGFIGVSRDISEEKQGEERLLVLQRVLERSDAIVIIMDSHLNVEYANPRLFSLSGASPEKTMGQNILSLNVSADARQVISGLIKEFGDGRDMKTEVQFKKKNGKMLWLSSNITPIRNENGCLTHVMVIQVDITEKKKALEEKRRSELYFKEVCASSLDGMRILDHNGNCLFVNDAFCRMFKMGRKSLIGFPFYVIYDQQLQRRMKAKNSFGTETKQILPHMEKVARLWDGRSAAFDIVNSYIESKEESWVLLSVFRDITDRKKTEAELLNARTRAEESDRLKSEFLAQVSHEIRTPINTMLSFTSLLKDELDSNVPEYLHDSFYFIEENGRRLIRTVDLILNMSEVQTGQIELRPSKINLEKEVFKNLLFEFNYSAGKKGLGLNFLCDLVHPNVWADQYTVTQIFENILDNAIKYTQKGAVEIKISEEKNDLCVAIKDTGIGISDEYMKRMFVPFSQEKTGYSRPYEGNGLGLALVKKYIDLNNASIEVISEKGNGSSFNVRLPKFSPS